MNLCERCVEDGLERTGQWVVERDAYLCDSCETTLNEAAYERMCEDYYGGGGNQTMDEHYQAAAKQKREQR